MSRPTQITVDMVLRSQINVTGGEQEYDLLLQMSDVGRWIAWDEIGYPLGIYDSKVIAQTEIVWYAWTDLEGSDPRLHSLPMFNCKQELEYVAEKLATASQIVRYYDSESRSETFLRLRDDKTWYSMNLVELDEYHIKTEEYLAEARARRNKNAFYAAKAVEEEV